MNQPQFFKLVSIHNAKDKTVRHRVCHHISGVMGELKEDMEIDDELWQGLQAALLMRCRDKIAAVRAVAASAMVRLQVRESLGRCPIAASHARTHSLSYSSIVAQAGVPLVHMFNGLEKCKVRRGLVHCSTALT